VKVQWEVTLEHGRVGLRPLNGRDQKAWYEVQGRNRSWLGPWGAPPPHGGGRPSTFAAMVRAVRKQASAGLSLPFVITWDGNLVGQLTVSGIALGSARMAQIGYWIDRRVANRGITTLAVAMATDYCLSRLALHRVELVIRPENNASLRVAHKLGFTEEGLRRRFLHIDGGWRDHLAFSILAEDVPGGLVKRLEAAAARGEFTLPA